MEPTKETRVKKRMVAVAATAFVLALGVAACCNLVLGDLS
jgi:hypothetical protein